MNANIFVSTIVELLLVLMPGFWRTIKVNIYFKDWSKMSWFSLLRRCFLDIIWNYFFNFKRNIGSVLSHTSSLHLVLRWIIEIVKSVEERKRISIFYFEPLLFWSFSHSLSKRAKGGIWLPTTETHNLSKQKYFLIQALICALVMDA